MRGPAADAAGPFFHVSIVPIRAASNVGYVSKVPIFDHMIDDYAGAMNPDPKNEEFISAETRPTFATPF